MGDRPTQDADPVRPVPAHTGPAEPSDRVPPTEQGELAGWYRMAGVGTEFIAAVAVFGGVGYGLDRWLGSSPWLLLIGCGLGFAVGLWLMYKAARKTFQ
jgi:ATP synthase protein I